MYLGRVVESGPAQGCSTRHSTPTRKAWWPPCRDWTASASGTRLEGDPRSPIDRTEHLPLPRPLPVGTAQCTTACRNYGELAPARLAACHFA